VSIPDECVITALPLPTPIKAPEAKNRSEKDVAAAPSTAPSFASGKKLVFAVMVVPTIVVAEVAPIVVASIVPPFISVVVRTDEADVRTPVFELKVRLVFVFGPRSPVAAVKNAIKQEVSVASSATVIAVGVPALTGTHEVTPEPFV
jgi:hypothetical protein